MVVTVIPAGPHGVIGPGIGFRATVTPDPGPLSALRLFISTLPGPGQTTWLEVFPPDLGVTHFVGTGTVMIPQATSAPLANVADDQVNATVALVDPGGITVDSGQLNVTWDPSAGLGWLQTQVPTKGSGLTQEQADQLQRIDASTALTVAVDQLLLVELTSGPQGGNVSAFLNRPVFGVIVRISSLPSGLVPQTPDHDYWVPTLATVRIFRGSDIWIRAPVHTSSKIVNFQVEGLASFLAAMFTAEWILDLSLQVDFLAGVTGQVFLMNVP